MHLTAYAVDDMLVDMLELLTTDEFAGWFSALGDREAEAVATGLELIETLGPERSPPTSCDALLWYQSAEKTPFEAYLSGEYSQHAARLRRMFTHLMSATVQKKNGEASAERAIEISRAYTALGQHTRFRLSAATAERAWLKTQRHYRHVLSLLGVEEPDRDAPSDALRELRVGADAGTPDLRVLYGVDVAKRRALVVLGERLDRRAYGPSVRRALSVWREFMASDHEADRSIQVRSER